jgi:thiol:disulfide interchange protein DsbC
MKYFCRLLVLLGSFLSISAYAADMDPGASHLQSALAKLLPNTKVTQIKPTPIKGLYEVIVGTQLVYMNADASYFIDGDMVQMSTHKNLTEASKSIIRLDKIKNYPESQMVVYTPPDKIKHSITVVTDLYCPYCRRLHAEMNQYMADGIKVRYLFMPLKGQQDYDATVSVWCAKDQRKALDAAYAGGHVEAKTCTNPISEHLNMARSLGVNGTPAIIMDDGEMLPGYVPEKQLLKTLDAKS